MIILNNITVGLKLAALQLLPFFGILIGCGRLGFPLGLLLKSSMAGSTLPPLLSVMLILPHGIPEYAGFLLMQNSVSGLYVLAFSRLFGAYVNWKRAVRFSVSSMAAGVTLIVIAGFIEGYATPVIAGGFLNR
jgi:uncharacterized membrane protein SpoIIM required for sporulation